MFFLIQAIARFTSTTWSGHVDRGETR